MRWTERHLDLKVAATCGVAVGLLLAVGWLLTLQEQQLAAPAAVATANETTSNAPEPSRKPGTLPSARVPSRAMAKSDPSLDSEHSESNVPTRSPAATTSAPTTRKPTPRPTATRHPSATPVPKLIVSRSANLTDGDVVTVSGTGFNPAKGIYVAFCVRPEPGQPPSPCGGGADTDGSSNASQWISSNPPPYGKSLAIPYSSGGSFRVSIRVSEVIGDVDCRAGHCVIATRADHTRSSDRSQDVFVPITFRSN